MPRTITQYSVFIGSPGGLKQERELFRARLEQFNRMNLWHRGVAFHPVGWEETLAGVGRPQGRINEDIEQCDFAVFLFHDRWGTPSDLGGSSVGTEEELALCEKLYEKGQIRNIILFFKSVAKAQLNDPGEQLNKVLAFKKKVEAEKRHLFKSYARAADYAVELDCQLASWLVDHERRAGAGAPALDELVKGGISEEPHGASGPRSFEHWIGEARYFLEPGERAPDYSTAAPMAVEAVAAAADENEKVEALLLLGRVSFHINDMQGAIAAYDEAIALADDEVSVAGLRDWAQATIGKALTLARLKRPIDEEALYDRVIDRLTARDDLSLANQLARALLNKGTILADAGRNAEAIGVWDRIIRRHAGATQRSLREQVCYAYYNKARGLLDAGDTAVSIIVYDELIARFSADDGASIREQVAKAYINKAVALDREKRVDEALASLDEAIVALRTTGEDAVRNHLPPALNNKAILLIAQHRWAQAVSLADEVLRRVGDAADTGLREDVVIALTNRASGLHGDKQYKAALATYDELLARFNDAAEPDIVWRVASASFSRAIVLYDLGRFEEELSCEDEFIRRYGDAEPVVVQQLVATAMLNKSGTLRRLRRRKDAAAALHALLVRFAQHTDPDIADAVARARSLISQREG